MGQDQAQAIALGAAADLWFRTTRLPILNLVRPCFAHTEHRSVGLMGHTRARAKRVPANGAAPGLLKYMPDGH